MGPGLGIADHKLCGIRYQQSPNHGGLITPTLAVVHYTAGTSLKGAVKTLTRPEGKVSAHVVIGQCGEIVQLLLFNVRGWHAGASSYMGRSGVNDFSIGIELVNPGYLTETGIRARHKHGGPIRTWAPYPEVQIRSCAMVCAALGEYYEITDIVGHDDVSPKRKLDPGPAWDWLTFYDFLRASSHTS